MSLRSTKKFENPQLCSKKWIQLTFLSYFGRAGGLMFSGRTTCLDPCRGHKKSAGKVHVSFTQTGRPRASCRCPQRLNPSPIRFPIQREQTHALTHTAMTAIAPRAGASPECKEYLSLYFHSGERVTR